jgi:hypothetical protein
MKRFLIASLVLALVFVISWINVLPIRCEVCGKVVLYSNIAAEIFGGHGHCVHAGCCPEFHQVTLIPTIQYDWHLEQIPGPS